jgi:hypothetical protein
MNFKRLLNTPVGVLLISILLGFGIACLFRRVCTDGQCIHFQGAVIDRDHIYEHDKKCFQYIPKSMSCNQSKKIIDVGNPPGEDE